MNNRTLLALAVACSPMFAAAHNLTVGQPAPSVDVASHGEIVVKDNDTVYQAWSSNDMLGKVRVVQAIAGRSSSKEMNAPLMAAITASQFPSDSYQTTTIINQDDAIWGTGSFVKSSAQDSKIDFPWSSMVLDEDGAVASAWDLQTESSAIIVQDKQGKVLFVKEGSLSESDVKQVLELIAKNL
ncbi:YtfJ family protein [Vibrio sp. 404]|uniref:YtfJ family protein n=1 Tax=Vibrio marinisediminis TaxID=2758441 RepID=A0A7W2IVE6_9VIBR|nr:YtfJ family protein [Vibrio marinisediminis]MBA5764541.1 YtfJ family protein [Vibrio marinisediminis]